MILQYACQDTSNSHAHRDARQPLFAALNTDPEFKMPSWPKYQRAHGLGDCSFRRLYERDLPTAQYLTSHATYEGVPPLNALRGKSYILCEPLSRHGTPRRSAYCAPLLW